MSLHTLKIAHLCRLRSTTSLLTVTLGLVLLAVPERAMAQIVPVCDRTPEVRDIIVEKIPGVSDCGYVTEAHLAVITGFLDLEGPHIVWGFRAIFDSKRADRGRFVTSPPFIRAFFIPTLLASRTPDTPLPAGPHNLKKT